MKTLKFAVIGAIVAFNLLLITNKSFATVDPSSGSNIQRGNKWPYNGVWMCSCPAVSSQDPCYCAY